MRYSEQQQEIIDSPTFPGGRKVVRAYSGCGKSTTLIGYANHPDRLSKKILYITFNKSVALEAAKKFPKHVDCKTINALAYSYCGAEYKETLGDCTLIALQEYFEPKKIVKNRSDLLALCYHAKATFDAWCSSASDSPDSKHISLAAVDAIAIGCFTSTNLIDCVLAILDGMLNRNLAFGHNLYVKLFQLQGPDLPYDIIMVDEGQDLNPVVIDVLLHQLAEVIIVGDSHQSIYAFMHAVDSLESIPNSTVFNLTETYRFGQNLAEMASNILINHKKAELPLIGKGSPILIDEFENPEMEKYIKCPLYIARTKAGIIDILIGVLLDSETSKKVYLPGGAKNYKFGELTDAYHLFKNAESRGSMTPHKSWESFEDFAEISGAPDAQNTVRLVKRYKGAITSAMIELKKKEVGTASKADLCVTTAHKSKGLEHPFVVICDDFPKMNDVDAEPVSVQEINLCYVALTRAQKAIHTTDALRYLVNSKKLARKYY